MDNRLNTITDSGALQMNRSVYIGVAEPLKNQYMKIVFTNEEDIHPEVEIVAGRKDGTTIHPQSLTVEAKYNEPVYRLDVLESIPHELITEVMMPKETKVLGAQLLVDTKNLKNITLPPTLEKIEHVVFPGSGLTEVKIPDTVKSIGENAFAECYDAVIYLPATIGYVSESAFAEVKTLHYSGELEGAPWGAKEWIKD